MKIVQIIVLYNKKIVNPRPDTFYFDNSTNEQIMQYNNQFESVIPMNGNQGLSKVYNQAIDMFQADYDFMQILDDDSQLEDGFIEQFTELINHSSTIADFYVPTVISNADQKIKFPIYRSDNIFKKLLNRIVPNQYDIKVINSGLILNLKTKPPKFDEQLFLYGVDYEYSRRVIAPGNYQILDLKLYQNFSMEDSNIDNLIHRYRMVTKDGKHYYNRFDYYVNYTLIYLGLCRKHKTMRFIPEILKL